METMFWVWLGVIVFTAVLEIMTTDLISIWFTFGAIIPFILSLTTALSVGWQMVIFILISALLLACLRKITLKFFFKNSDSKTNLDTLIGQKFKMLETAAFDNVGTIKVKGVEWSAIGQDKETIEKGAVVEVIRISGNKLIVKEVSAKSQDEEPKSKNTSKNKK